MLATLLPPTGGEATVAGCDLRRQPGEVRRRIRYVSEAGGTQPEVTGRSELVLQGRLYGLSKAEAVRRAAETIETFGLESCADRRTPTYSGGQKRRLQIAIGMVQRPPLLFLDEPTTGLDPQSRTALWGEVGRLSRDEGVTVFLTTQYLEEADVLADRVGIIDHGHIVAEGTPARLKAEIGRPTVEVVPEQDSEQARLAALLSRFGSPTAARPGASAVQLDGHGALADVIRALDQEQLRAAAINLHQPSLDDVFLAKTGRKLEGAEDEEETA